MPERDEAHLGAIRIIDTYLVCVRHPESSMWLGLCRLSVGQPPNPTECTSNPKARVIIRYFRSYSNLPTCSIPDNRSCWSGPNMYVLHGSSHQMHLTETRHLDYAKCSNASRTLQQLNRLIGLGPGA